MNITIAKNDIIKLEPYQYKKFTEKLVKKISEIPQVKSIYQMGGWTQPGISDIDLILVTGTKKVDQIETASVSKKDLCNDEKGKYMLMHGPFVIPEKLFPDINSIFYCSDLKKLYGKSLDLHHYNDSFKIVTEIYKLVSVLAHSYPRFYFINTVSLRSFLTFSYSLKHTYQILQELNSSFESREVEDYIESITLLRKDAAENLEDKEVDITSFVNAGVLVSKIMFKEIEKIILKKFQINISSAKKFFYIKNLENVYRFLPMEKCKYDVVSHGNFKVIDLPLIFVPFILFPLNDHTNITRFQKKNIIGKIGIDIPEELSGHLLRIKNMHDLYKTLHNRIKVINGMSFELNTTLFWSHEKLRISNFESLKVYIYKKLRLLELKRKVRIMSK